jgi:hypothetical protein
MHLRPSAVAWSFVVVIGASPLSAAQWLNYPTPVIPRLPDGKPNLTAPTPSAVDGKPDLSGIWAVECSIYGRDGCFTRSLFFDLAKDLPASDVEMTPWAAAIQAQRASRNHVDDPYVKPWTVKTVLNLLPDAELIEAFCISAPPPEPPSPRLP